MLGRLGVLVVAAALLAAVHAPPPVQAAPTPAVVASWCRPTTDGYRCMVGPIAVPPGRRVELMTGVAAPSEAGFLTDARATLVDGRGEEIGHETVHLHHVVWLNPYARDLTCDSYDEGLPGYERFFASGGERTPVVLPDGYGYHWQPPLAQPQTRSAPFWGLVAMLDGMQGQADAFIQLDVGFVPAGAATGIVPVRPLWLDVRNCSSHPVYNVEEGSGSRGVHAETWQIAAPLAGRFVFLGGHLHPGGLALRLDNATTGNHLFASEAVYGKPGHPWCLTGMTTWSHPAGHDVARGDLLRLTALYDSSERREHVMGIMLGALAVDAAGAQAPPLPDTTPNLPQPHHGPPLVTPLPASAEDPCAHAAASPGHSDAPSEGHDGQAGGAGQPGSGHRHAEPVARAAGPLPATGGGAPAAAGLLLVAAAAAAGALRATRRSTGGG